MNRMISISWRTILKLSGQP